MKIGTTLSASVFEFFAEAHENKMRFKGILVRLDEPSTKPPNGSQGHRIMIPKSVAEQKLHTLKSMGLNYANDLKGHAPTHKVGVIEKAWIAGQDLWVSGTIWKKDFPDAEKDLKKDGLGMSFEASDIEVENVNADIWKITDLCFTGATILYKNAAAYQKTQAIAAAKAAEQIKNIDGGKSMSKKKDKKKVAAMASKKGGSFSVEDAIKQLIQAQNNNTSALRQMCASTESLISTVLKKRVEATAGASQSAESNDVSISAEAESEGSVEAAAGSSSGSSSESVDAAGGRKSSNSDSADSTSTSTSSSESMDADADDQGELEHMGDGSESDEPGHLNKSAKNHGSDTTLNDKQGKSVSSSALKQLTKKVDQVVKANADLAAENKKLRKELKKQKIQAAAAAEKQGPRSMQASALTKNLLSKNGVDVNAIQASGIKLSVDEADEMLAKGNLSITQRVAVKSEMARIGVMDEGYVKSV